MNDPIGFLCLCHVFFAVAALAVLGLKTGGVIRIRWVPTLQICLALALAAAGCLYVAASISANI
jgi:hypothetical protein